MSGRFAARLVVRIGRSDVGRRISLRRRLPTGEYSDVVGVLESWSGGTLTVRRRSGELVEVPEETMVAAKVVPPQPPPRRRPRVPVDQDPDKRDDGSGGVT
ncbi:MAG TPA: hypothetical protein VIL71_09030 [Spirillospora sp.]|mgnify:CR=1 FL=1